MKTLTEKQLNTLTGLLLAVDEIGGWPTIEQKIAEQGSDDPDADYEDLRRVAFG